MAFSVPFNEPTNNLIDKIRKAVTDNKGTFTGDNNGGQIKMSTPIGQIHGSYKIEGQNIIVEILNKPFFISEETIKQEIIKLIK